MGDVGSLENVQIEQSGDDVYVRGRVVRGGIDPTG
jgi:hypothetical protein